MRPTTSAPQTITVPTASVFIVDDDEAVRTVMESSDALMVVTGTKSRTGSKGRSLMSEGNVRCWLVVM